MNSLSVVTLAVRFNVRVKGVLVSYFIACDGRGEESRAQGTRRVYLGPRRLLWFV